MSTLPKKRKNQITSEELELLLDLFIESISGATKQVETMCNNIRKTSRYFEENRKKGIYPHVD